ncbi:MAG: UDP-N-acetylglucosamine kinase [Patescibacteria group bacterium]|nr:UDP-N-acetylglucosamine kinase [Patescibacteria group bacterium]
MSEEALIKERAEEYARKNKKVIAKEITNLSLFIPDEFPVSVFMAGSPGAGKTESSRNLIEKLSKDSHFVLRIDPDELRSKFSEYNGTNSSLFMSATSIIADNIQDCALKNKQSFVFDGTLSNLDRSKQNIQRSLNKNRFTQILYVYQEPLQAWNFVKAREQKDGRKVPLEAFINQYFLARTNTNLLKKEFGNKLRVDLVVKNIDGTDFNYRENIDVVDNYIPEKYTVDDLRKLIII